MTKSHWSVVALLLATLSFGGAIAARDIVNPWWSNLGAAAIAIGLASAVLAPDLRRLLAVHLRGVGIAAALGAAMVVATHLGFRLGIMLFPGLENNVAQLYADIRATPSGALTIPLVVVIVAAEELLWRGVAIDWCRSRLPVFAVAPAATGLYVLPQLIGGAWILIAAAALVGAIATMQRLITDRITEPLVTHAIWSVSIFSLAPLT